MIKLDEYYSLGKLDGFLWLLRYDPCRNNRPIHPKALTNPRNNLYYCNNCGTRHPISKEAAKKFNFIVGGQFL